MPQGVAKRAGASDLDAGAVVYFGLVAAAAGLAALPFVSRLKANTPGWTTFVILGLIAASAQLFVVITPRNQSYHTTIVFLIAAAMLLPPELVALMGVVQHVPEWVKNRSAWYVQSFNISNWTLASLTAWASFHGVLDIGSQSGARWALAGLAAACSMVAVNH